MTDLYRNEKIKGGKHYYVLGKSWMGHGSGVVIYDNLVILGIIYLLKLVIGAEKQKGETSLEVLKKRYVKGEITKEEFEEKKKDII